MFTATAARMSALNAFSSISCRPRMLMAPPQVAFEAQDEQAGGVR
jgi:hypothetical protein